MAAFAILLSQIPPIRILLKRAKLDVGLHSKIIVTHKVGNPNLQIPLVIQNVGGRRIRLKRIEARVTKDDKEVALLRGWNYLRESDSKNPVLFTGFTLNPTDERMHIFNFFNFREREEERKYQSMEKALKKNILNKNSNKGMIARGMEADDEYVAPFIDFFKEKFIWNAGEYKLSLSIFTDRCKADIQKIYRFILFESHSEDLAQIKDEYKTGAGIFRGSDTQASVLVDVVEWVEKL